MENILSILIWLPVVGMVAIAFIPREKEELIRITAAVTTGIQFLFTLFCGVILIQRMVLCSLGNGQSGSLF